MKKIINGKEYMRVLHCCLPIWLATDENEEDCNVEGIFVPAAFFLGELIPGLAVEKFENGETAFKFLPYKEGDYYLKVLFRSFF